MYNFLLSMDKCVKPALETADDKYSRPPAEHRFPGKIFLDYWVYIM